MQSMPKPASGGECVSPGGELRITRFRIKREAHMFSLGDLFRNLAIVIAILFFSLVVSPVFT